MKIDLLFKYTLTFICCLVFSLASQAQIQKNWELGGFAGLSNYQGDLVPTHFFAFQENDFAFGFYAKRYLSQNWGVRLAYYNGSISGDDQDFDVRDERLARFTSPLSEISLRFDIEAPMDKAEVHSGAKTGFVPFFFAGVALSTFEPDTEYGLYEGADFAQGWIATDKQELKSQTSIAIPIGVGLKYQLPSGWNLALEMGYRPVFSDYLDGVSESGNPRNDDSYVFAGLSVGRRFSFIKDSDGDSVPNNEDQCPNVVGIPALGGCPDQDEDGIVDKEDACPQQAGSVTAKGCPDEDNDGVADSKDACPRLAGTAALQGCPDTDGDGVVDPKDDCPGLKGIASLQGCPDSDGDGVIDPQDDCPQQKGSKAMAGCPDSDGDGIGDNKDRCPNQVGIAANNGCPVQEKDTDGDGVPDKEDRCPTVKGLVQLKGCVDTDGDGVSDPDDKCPDKVGPMTNFGCPEIEKEDIIILDLAVKNVNFRTGQARLTTASYPVLDQVATLLQKYPDYNLKIDGYTDSKGNDAVNQQLSERRAAACLKYLVTKGITAERITAKGYGETNPVATNETAEGRELNRRVEFDLYLK